MEFSENKISEPAPRITVIMGIYNCADTLRDALDSLVVQTYKRFKVIICDDGSTDNTYSIAKEYVEKYPEMFFLIRNEHNKGLNYTLNRCLEYADTEYVARMDGDDMSLPERFEKEIEFLDSHPEFQILSTPMIYFDENGDYARGKGGYEPKAKYCRKGSPFCHPTVMVRTEAFKAVEGYTVSDDLLRYEDYHLWINMFNKGFRGLVLDEPLYRMRADKNSIRKRHKNRSIRKETNLQKLAIKKLNLPKWSYIYLLRTVFIKFLPLGLYSFLHKKNLSKIQ